MSVEPRATAVAPVARPLVRFPVAHHAIVPKGGHAMADCEDALEGVLGADRVLYSVVGGADDCVPLASTMPPARVVHRFGVADGATESYQSGPWARALASAFAHGRLFADRQRWPDLLQPVRSAWAGSLPTSAVPWFLEEKRAAGAFAALVGLSVEVDTDHAHADRGDWSALATGDSCLFHVSGDRLAVAFPLSAPEQFNAPPLLIGSVRPATRDVSFPSTTSGEWVRGDRFFLMSDAIARWFLTTALAGGKPWDDIEPQLGPGRHEAFLAWIDRLRFAGTLRNDDVAVIRVRMEAGP